MSRAACLGLLVGIVAAASGCLFTHHSDRILREKEVVKAVKFESPEAQQLFTAKVADRKEKDKNGEKSQVTAIPFLLWYSRTDKLSDAAWYNDQMTTCDSNKDGIISMREVYAYNAAYLPDADKLVKKDDKGEKPGEAAARAVSFEKAAPMPPERR